MPGGGWPSLTREDGEFMFSSLVFGIFANLPTPLMRRDQHLETPQDGATKGLSVVAQDIAQQGSRFFSSQIDEFAISPNE